VSLRLRAVAGFLRLTAKPRMATAETGRAWAGGDDPADPRLSPVNGPLAGLPPVRIGIGTRDLLHPDVLRLRDRAAAEGARVDLTGCPGAVHVYPLTPTPEGRAGTREVVAAVAGDFARRNRSREARTVRAAPATAHATRTASRGPTSAPSK